MGGVQGRSPAKKFLAFNPPYANVDKFVQLRAALGRGKLLPVGTVDSARALDWDEVEETTEYTTPVLLFDASVPRLAGFSLIT
jgi:hypothetical protein